MKHLSILDSLTLVEHFFFFLKETNKKALNIWSTDNIQNLDNS